MGGVAQNTKRRRARDNSREHPTGDCRLAARRGRREVEGASPSPVSSRESRRHDDAEMAFDARAFFDTTYAGQRGYSFFQEAARVGFCSVYFLVHG